MRESWNRDECNRHDDNKNNNKNKTGFIFSFIAFLILITYVAGALDSGIFMKGFFLAMGQPSNQSHIVNNNYTKEGPALIMSNITKMTTTQGNESTNANSASTFPPKEANSTQTFPDTNKVAIILGAALKRDKAYQPNPINIKAGGTVTWTNEDTVVHTVTSGSGIDYPNIGREFDSGFLGKGFSHIFFKAGTFPYFCQIHPTMIGKVVVK